MFRKMLVPVDGSACSNRAARTGLELARRLNLPVLFTHVVHPRDGEDHARKDIRVAEMLLEHWTRLAGQASVEAHSRIDSDGDVGELIVRAAEFEACDLIVMGTHGREGVPRVLLGSVAERVSRLAHVPVMLVRAAAEGADDTVRLGRILVAVDGSGPSYLALERARELTRALGANLEILHVIPDVPIQYAYLASEYGSVLEPDRYQRDLETESQAIAAAALEQVRGDPSVAAHTKVTRLPANGQRIGDVIARAGHERADLIVIGTHGYRGFDRVLLGSVAERVAHRADVPVLLVRMIGTDGGDPGSGTHHQEVTS